MKGLVISGGFGNICVREKSNTKLELGELLIADTANGKILLQIFDLFYGSQLSQQNLELVSGLKLEEDSSLNFMDFNIRNYVLAKLKSLVTINQNSAHSTKTLPDFFSEVREVTKQDLLFLTTPSNPLFLGNLRSGSKILDLPIFIDGEKAFSHHILVCGTTGRGKSVFMNNLLWSSLSQDYCSILVLDPHDEYFGRSKFGLKDNENARDKLVYYTSKNPPTGARTLKINISQIIPQHFFGVVDWSDAQQEALFAYFKEFKQDWISAIVLEKPLQNVKFGEATLSVVKRRLMQLLNLSLENENVFSKGVFDLFSGETTVNDIVNDLENSKTVIIDTSDFSGNVELLVGSMIANEVLNKYKCYNFKDLEQKPVISIVLEEAPRVLGKDVLEKGSNIFSTIAREGRKFRIGLTAITQLPSLIPKDILANINTKIILGIEMKQERQAIIESAAQDLSEDDRMIASLDKGEAIVTSNFLKFATPIKIPMLNESLIKQKLVQRFDGIKWNLLI